MSRARGPTNWVLGAADGGRGWMSWAWGPDLLEVSGSWAIFTLTKRTRELLILFTLPDDETRRGALVPTILE